MLTGRHEKWYLQSKIHMTAQLCFAQKMLVKLTPDVMEIGNKCHVLSLNRWNTWGASITKMNEASGANPIKKEIENLKDKLQN